MKLDRLLNEEPEDPDAIMNGLAQLVSDPGILLNIMKLLQQKSYLQAAVAILSASPAVSDKIYTDLENVDENSDSWYHFTSDHVNAISRQWPKLVEQLELPELLLTKLNNAVKNLVAWHIKIRQHHKKLKVQTAQCSDAANRYSKTTNHLDKLVKT